MKLMLELSRIFNSMEVHTVNNLHNTAAILSSLQGAASVAAAASVANPSPSPKKKAANAGSASAKQSSTEAAILEQLSKQQQQQQQPVANLSRDCESPSSSNSELGQDFAELQDMNGSLTGSGSVGKSNGSLSGASSTNSAPAVGSGSAAAGSGTANANANNSSSINGTQASGVIAAHLKKRISSSRTPTRKAHRIKFYRNGDRFYPGITIPVSNERYRSFESLYEDLTRLLEENVKIPGAVRAIYNMSGKKVSGLRKKVENPINKFRPFPLDHSPG